jgi:AcrR family transcriptional regulator
MLQAAERIMGEKGFDGATMQEIAAAAGCAVGTLYLHFKNKEELLRGILLKHGVSLKESMVTAFQGVSDPLEKLRIFIKAHLEWTHQHPAVTELVGKALPMRYYEFQASLRRILPQEHAEMQQFELQFIQEAQESGRIRRDIPAKALTELVDGFMFTVMDQFSARPNAYSLQDQLDLTWGFLTTGLQAGCEEKKTSQPKKKHA